MSSPNTNNLFLSQRIELHSGSPPLLLPTGSSNGYNTKQQNISPYTELVSDSDAYQPEEEDGKQTATWGMTITVSSIPTLPIYYILEPASITLYAVPVSTAESRIADFLRINSICFTYHADTVSLDCVTSTMLKFVIQFWRVGSRGNGTSTSSTIDPNHSVTIELQRRQGSVIEMQSIRRRLFQAAETGEQMPASMGRSPMQAPTLPDTIMADVDAIANYDHDKGRTDALQISIGLLESNNRMDQTRLGLESLRMMTDASIVSRQDALAVSKAVLFKEGPFGARLQDALARYSFGRAAAAAERATMSECQSNQGYSQYEGFHSLALGILSNALELVENESHGEDGENISIDLTGSFWELVSADLLYNVQKAVQTPNEGAASARCIRCIKSLSSNIGPEMIVPAMVGPRGLRACLAQAHQFGARHHWMLEQESQKLLDTYC